MWRYLQSSFALNLLLIILALIVGYSSFSMIRHAIELSREKKTGEMKIKELSGTKEKLEARIAEFGTPEALEREAKLRLNLKRKGEKVVVVLPEEKINGEASAPGFTWEKLRRFLHLK